MSILPIPRIHTPLALADRETFPFSSPEEAWFWFMQAQKAMNDGARFRTGSALIPRPCEPMDILKVLDRLYRNRVLMMDHFLVLRHYGRRMFAPDPRRPKECKAWNLWREAMDKLGEALERKGIVCRPVSPESLQNQDDTSDILPFQAPRGWQEGVRC
jgi:hypothetical protein